MPDLDLSKLPTSNDPTQVLAHCPSQTACLPISILPIPTDGAMINDHHATERIFVAHQGNGQRWYRSGGRTASLHTAPRMIELYERGTTFDQCEWKGERPGRCVLVEFGESDLLALTHGDLCSLGLRTEHEVFDDRVSRITFELAAEALAGIPNGRLYAQGLSIALVGLLASRCAGGADVNMAPAIRRFGVLERTRLLSLMRDQRGDDLPLTRLAEEVGMSAFHFARVFKATFGATPHRYLLDIRLEAAVQALRCERQQPIVEIALANGFASQSHMTELMRRRLGITPRAIRNSP